MTSVCCDLEPLYKYASSMHPYLVYFESTLYIADDFNPHPLAEELRGVKKPHHSWERNSQLEGKEVLSHHSKSYIYLLRTICNLCMQFSYTVIMPPWTTSLVQWPPYAIILNRCINMPLRCTLAKFIWKYLIYCWWFPPILFGGRA